MFNRKQIKANAKAAMKGHLGLAILVMLVIGLLACVASANLGTRFGTYWGLERRLFTNAITGKTTSTEYDRLNPASPYYKPDYTVDDYRDTTYTAFANGNSYKAFECKWVSFKANTDDFAIALNVDGAVTYIDTIS